MIADTQWKLRRQRRVVQRILRTGDRHVLRIRSHAEHRHDALLLCWKSNTLIANNRILLLIAVKPSLCAVAGQIQQRLHVGQRMVAARTAHSAVQMEFFLTVGQTVLDGQHHIAVILFHRHAVDMGKIRHYRQRVKVPQQQIRHDTLLFAVLPAAVGSDDIVARLRPTGQAIVAARPKNNTGHNVCLLSKLTASAVCATEWQTGAAGYHIQ